MALFLVLALDKPDVLALRAATRPAHLDFVRVLGARIKFSGPLLSESGEAMIGSVLLIEADDRAALDELLAADPDARAGLFANVQVHRYGGAPPRS